MTKAKHFIGISFDQGAYWWHPDRRVTEHGYPCAPKKEIKRWCRENRVKYVPWHPKTYLLGPLTDAQAVLFKLRFC